MLQPLPSISSSLLFVLCIIKFCMRIDRGPGILWWPLLEVTAVNILHSNLITLLCVFRSHCNLTLNMHHYYWSLRSCYYLISNTICWMTSMCWTQSGCRGKEFPLSWRLVLTHANFLPRVSIEAEWQATLIPSQWHYIFLRPVRKGGGSAIANLCLQLLINSLWNVIFQVQN